MPEQKNNPNNSSLFQFFSTGKKNESEELAQNIPVHTMKSDLANLGETNNQQTNTPRAASIVTKPETPQHLPVKPSPFLEQKKAPSLPPKQEIVFETKKPAPPVEKTELPTKTNLPPIPIAKPESTAQSIQNIIPTKKDIEEKILFREEAARRKGNGTFIIVLILLALLLLTAGGYYYWIETQKEKSTSSTNDTPKPEPTPIQRPSFTTDKANYLSVDFENANTESLKDTIKKTAEKIKTENITLPVEFLLTDQKNNPLAFSAYAQKAKLTLSSDIMDSLDDNFSLFLYNENGQVKSGLVITLKNTSKLKEALLKSEPTLPAAVESIFLTSEFTIPIKPFASSIYNGTDIRYKNIISPEDLSVDYAIYNNKFLVFATTKQSIRSILDVLQKNDSNPTPVTTENPQ